MGTEAAPKGARTTESFVPVVELDTIRASDAPGPGSSPGGHTNNGLNDLR